MKRSALAAHIATPLLGVATGLRSFTPLAVTAWFAQQKKLPVNATWASWVGHPASVTALTAAALGEYVGDKLPNTPNRTAPVPFLGRLALGGTVGAIVATAYRRPVWGGISMGVVGAALGAYCGFYLRKGLSQDIGMNDLAPAISGDAAAVALAIRALRRLTA